MRQHSLAVRTLLGLAAVASLALPLLLAIAISPMLPASPAARRFDGLWDGVACVGGGASALPIHPLLLELSIDWGARESRLLGLFVPHGTIRTLAASGTAGWTRRGLVLDIPLADDRTMSIAVNSRVTGRLTGFLSLLDSQHRAIPGSTVPVLLTPKTASFARFVQASRSPCPGPARTGGFGP